VSAQQVTRHLLERSQVRYSRASGPGGQHRDHTESRAELVIGRDALDGLPDDVAARLLDRLHLTKRPLRLASQNDRSRERNRATVERALLNRVEAALRPRTTRKATRPSASSVARRLDQKAARSRTKNLRRRPEAD
jgi:ribosome-associated protein